MERPLARLALVGLLFFLSIPAGAIRLSLEPAAQSVEQGNSAFVDLGISDLGDTTAPSLGAFMVEIVFDETVLSFDSVVYGSFLGDTDPLAIETDISTTVGVGSVVLDEISFLLDLELDALQPASFTLATLTFTGDAVGVSALAFGTIDLANAEFPSTTIVPNALQTASITVEARQVSIPEPDTLLLLLTSLLTLVALRHRVLHM